jgi:hypothetical protein
VPTSVAVRSVAPDSDGVSPPPVIDRGADHVAVVRSLIEYGRWMEWHDPDPALVTRAYAPRSDLARGITREVNAMRSVRNRVVEVDTAPLEFVVVSVLPNVVSFRLTEHLARRDVIDLEGRVLEHVAPVTEHYIVLMMRFASSTPWRLLVVETQEPPIEVKL